MFLSDLLGWGGLLPGLLAAALFALRGGAAPGVAVSVAVILARSVSLGAPRLIPIEAVDHAVLLTLVGAVLGVFAHRARAVDIAGAVVILASGAQILAPRVAHGWTGADALWRPALALSIASGAWALARRAQGTVRATAPAMAFVVAGVAVALGATGSIVLARHAGLVAAATGGLGLVALWHAGGTSPGQRLLPAVVLPTIALVAAGVFYSELPAWAGAGFLACLAGLGVRSERPWKAMGAAGLPAVLLAALLAAAEWTAVDAQPY